MEEMKPVFLVKYEFEYREKLMFSSEVSDFQDSDARKKNIEYLVEYSTTSDVFSIRILMEEIEVVVSLK